MSMWLAKDSTETVRDGWESARLRYRHLRGGGQLAPLPPGTLRLAVDEITYVDMVLGHARFYAHDRAELVQTVGDAQQSRRVRWEIDEMTTPRWRDHSEVRTVLTSDRLLVDKGAWHTLRQENLLEITGDATEVEFVLRYDEYGDVMLYGSTAPFFAVAIAWLTYGERGLTLPVFEPIAAEIDGGPQPTEPAHPADPRFL